MAKLILALAGERYDHGGNDRGWKLVRYSHIGEFEAGDRVRDSNYLNGIAESLCDPKKGSSWIKGEPEAGQKKFFDIYLTALNHGKDDAVYKLDYHTYSGCPAQVIAEGMEIYRIIKSEGVRPCMEAIRMKRAAEKGKVKAKFAVDAVSSPRPEEEVKEVYEAPQRDTASLVRFEVGGLYEAVGTDSFGHIVREDVRIEGLMPDAGKVVFVSTHCKRPTVAKVYKTDDGESFQHKALCGVVRSNTRKVV